MLRPSENLEDKSRGFSGTISNPSTAFIATDDGMLRYIDMRKPGESIWEAQAHEGSIGGLSLSAVTRGLLTTAGHDEMLYVWKVKDGGSLDRVYAEKLTLGAPFSSTATSPLSTVPEDLPTTSSASSVD